MHPTRVENIEGIIIWRIATLGETFFQPKLITIFSSKFKCD